MKLYKCNKCEHVALSVNEKCSLTCCGEGMELLVANSVDAAVEKHVPVVSIEKNNVHVVCGEVLHPMDEKHYIESIILETNEGLYVKKFNPGMEASCDFVLNGSEEFISAYAYCNLHGLWKSNN